MAGYRRNRINEEIMREMTQIIRTVKDPRVSGGFLSITGADCTPDLKYAKIFYSVLGGDKKELSRGLSSASPYIRSRLAESLNLRVTPELTFIEDESALRSAHIAELLKSVEDDLKESDDDE